MVQNRTNPWIRYEYERFERSQWVTPDRMDWLSVLRVRTGSFSDPVSTQSRATDDGVDGRPKKLTNGLHCGS
eukprot:5592319-Prymnesium_polylepis.1